MDQTDFSLLVGFLVGSHAGAFGLSYFTGWSLWITYPTGGLIGLTLVAAIIFVSIEFIGRSRAKKGKR
jgi:hypothetical protein